MFINVDLKLLKCPTSTSELIAMLLLVAVTFPLFLLPSNEKERIKSQRESESII